MKCNQCEKPARYKWPGGILLCLTCHNAAEDLRIRSEELKLKQALLAAAMANQALDDMDAVSGIRTHGGRIPVAALAKALEPKVTHNHISISGSNIGVFNTGDLAKIDAVVTITEGSDAEELGEAIRALAQAIVDSRELQADAKKELGALLAELTQQVTTKRSKPVMDAVLDRIGSTVRTVGSLVVLVEKVAELAQSLGS